MNILCLNFVNFETLLLKIRDKYIKNNINLSNTMKVFLFFFLLSNVLLSQELTVGISSNPVTQGEKFRLEFTINGSGQNFKPPSFSGFNLISGPSVSSSTQIINGRFSQSQTWNYILEAPKTGTLFIGPASITVDGKTIKSERLKVDVLEPSQAVKEQRQQEKQQEETMQSQANNVIKDNLYVVAKANKNSAYLGEQVIATYTLYAHSELNIVELNIDKMPIFNGFWTQEFNVESNNKWQNEVINGVPFRKVEVKKVILYPQQTGKVALEPLVFNSVVRLITQGNNNSRNPFDQMFRRNSYKDFEYKVKSKELSVNIKELPSPRPIDFYGAVGNLKIETWFDKTTTVTGEPITLKMKVSGNGNLKLLSPPELKFPTGFEVYEPKLIDNSTVNLGGTAGNIQFEYLLIPRNAGEFKVGPIELSYFDLTKNAYSQYKSEEYLIKVGKGKANSTSSSNYADKEQIKYIGKDIRYIKEDINYAKKRTYFLSIEHVSVLSADLISLIFFILFKRKKDKDNNDTSGLKIRSANKVAKKRLSEAKKQLDIKDKEKFYEEIYRAIFGYLSDKLLIDTSTLNKEMIKSKLESKNISVEIVNSVLSNIDRCEYVRYAPNLGDDNLSNIYEEISDIIAKLEDKL